MRHMDRNAVYAGRTLLHVDTKISPVNLAMAQVLRDAEPKSISRKAAAARMSVTEGQLNRLLGGNPKYLRDISITVLYELAEVWGIDLPELVRRAEARAPEFAAQAAALSGATTTTDGTDDDFDFDPNVKPEDLGLAANAGRRKIDQGNEDDGRDETGDDPGSAGIR